jgi:hypothetical protein
MELNIKPEIVLLCLISTVLLEQPPLPDSATCKTSAPALIMNLPRLISTIAVVLSLSQTGVAQTVSRSEHSALGTVRAS